MYLCRIKNPEQLKHISPGEFGKLMGLDRVPEAKCLRKKIKIITLQNKASEWNASLSKTWVSEEDTNIFYIDGHVQVYHGDKAILGKKHVSRQKLCLPGVCEFWVNNSKGLPFFYVSGQVNEKLQEVLEASIIPQLISHMPEEKGKELSDEDMPLFTTVFDREGYSPALFERLWKLFRVAVITYRKNVKDSWDEALFTEHVVEVDGTEVKMNLAEKETILNGVAMREVREKCENGHQTSVITTNKKLSTTFIAIYMFTRWMQENFFKYMRQEYGFDRIVQYSINQLDENLMVVNQEYNNLTHSLKKVREKIARRKAILFHLSDESIVSNLDGSLHNEIKILKTREELEPLFEQETLLIEKRKTVPYKIKIKDMPENLRYNKLDEESKHFVNIIKMICFRAETAAATLLSTGYKKKRNEMRALTKSLIKNKADITPDYGNNTLTIAIYSMATPRDNLQVKKLCSSLNDSETIFPGTNLTMIFKMATH